MRADSPRHLLARAAVENARHRARDCARPVRLRGHNTHVDAATGEAVQSYRSVDELDGYTYMRCGNRRASVCPSCAREYKGDAWHLLACGLAGGKGIPETVTEHPAVFATLTAPSFGPVHGLRQRGPCRARRDRPVCVHERPLWCSIRHCDDDPRLGQPLCADCYDYEAHVLWQWHAPELWRRFTIALTRTLAAQAGLGVKGLRQRCRVAYTKVVEFQARGVIHVHAPIRLDGPDGPDTQPELALTVNDLTDAIRSAAAHVSLVVSLDDSGEELRLRWGAQVDVRPISRHAHRDGATGNAHPEQVAAYFSKYLTKTTEDFGLTSRVYDAAHAAAIGATTHAVRLIATAERIAETHTAGYGRLRAYLSTLGYRGHPVTKSRRYSVTFGALRRARRIWRQRRPGLDADAAIRELPADDDTDTEQTNVAIAEWRFVGIGYLDLESAAAAARAADLARSRH